MISAPKPPPTWQEALDRFATTGDLEASGVLENRLRMPNGIETGAFPFWHGRQGRTRLDDDAGPIFLRSADSGFVRQNDGQMARFDGLLAWNPNPSDFFGDDPRQFGREDEFA
jgi:hypothetical protein